MSDRHASHRITYEHEEDTYYIDLFSKNIEDAREHFNTLQISEGTTITDITVYNNSC